MVFSPFSDILIPHNECEYIISEEGQRKIFNFRKEKQMCITLGEYPRPGEETPPDILFSCLGSNQQIQEAEEFLKSLLPTSNSGLKRLGVVPPLVPLAPAVTSNPKRNRMVRTRFGRRGKSIVVFTNNCKVELESEDCFKTPMRAIALGLRGKQSENPQVALQVLNGTLRDNSAKQGNILVGQSIFSNEPEYFVYLEGGLYGWWGFYSNFRATQDGLFLNIDISSTVICSSGPVINFLCENQFVDHQHLIDWKKAERTLKNLRVKFSLTDEEFKITGLSELPCGEQLITTKDNDRDGNMDARSTEVTVHFYYLYAKNVKVCPHIPCINVGNQKKPIFLPIELCYLLPLQRWTKELSIGQTSNLKTLRQSQCKRLKKLTHKVLSSKTIFGEKVPGVSILPEFTRMGARVLSAPKLISGNGEVFPQNGRWNFNNQRLVHPAKVENWAIVNFSAQQCDIQKLWTDLVRCDSQKGIEIPEPSAVIEETSEDSRESPVDRVNTMFKKLKDTFSGPNKFLLCLLPERKNSPLYGPWKKMNLAHHGIVTQCVSPRPGKVNDRYLTNVLLKINAKLGGLNSLLSPLPLTSVTMILGMNISPGQSDRPAISAVVGSRQWPYSPLYSAAVRTQSGNVEMIDSLFKKVSDTDDEGIIRELLFDFQGSSGGRLPDQMVIFRAAVGESQFKQVLDIELAQIIEACKFIDKSWSPKFTVIVAQKNRHTRFFNKFGNVPPGTVIDTNVCHPLYNNFYLCTYDGAAVTSRPTHYHVLLDEIGFSPDDLQELVYSLSHGCQRSTTATSVVAPIHYARLASSQVAKFMKYEASTSTSVPLVSSLHKNVSRSMFFC